MIETQSGIDLKWFFSFYIQLGMDTLGNYSKKLDRNKLLNL